MRHALSNFLSASKFLSATAAGALLFGLPAAALAQSTEVRVDRLEKEMRAVQRKVFPAGAPIEAEITRAPTPTPTGTGSSAPIADLMARVTALESQLASITGQVEQNSFKIRQLEDSFNKYTADTDARLSPPEAAAPVAPAVKAPAVAAVDPAPVKAAPVKPAPAAPAPASEERKTAVAAIERPKTGNDSEDAYNYGYRLWDAKFYPEAQAQLKATVDKYGSAPIASKAQNLLGRAYLDDGKPALASVAFYENYQKRPRGDRAPDSLAYLGESLIQLKKPADACKVYEELEQVYGSGLSATLRGTMEKGRARAKCS
jgi:TolA-binding protein